MQLLYPDQKAVVLGTAPREEPAFQKRVTQLQNLRPGSWESLSCGTDLLAHLQREASNTKQVLLDAMSQWIAGLLLAFGADEESNRSISREHYVENQVSHLIQTILTQSTTRVVVVSAEVGGGPAPARTADRLYREQVGLANQRMAKAAATVISLSAGIPQVIKAT